MNYELLRGLIRLMEDFETFNKEENIYSSDINGLKNWIVEEALMENNMLPEPEPDWPSKENGRSPESVISTMLVHLSRYAKMYSKSVMLDSPFSTQEEFIYLINLKAFGAMGKMELIKLNIQDKPTGMQIINRLIKQGWVVQTDSVTDKRSKVIEITDFGRETLEEHMDKIRQATKIVSGDLSVLEKMQLISLLGKLTDFHKTIFIRNIDSADLLQKVMTEYLPSTN